MTPNSPTSAFGTHPPNDPNLLKTVLNDLKWCICNQWISRPKRTIIFGWKYLDGIILLSDFGKGSKFHIQTSDDFSPYPQIFRKCLDNRRVFRSLEVRKVHIICRINRRVNRDS